MIIALYAAIAMVAQDILGTLLTQAQARDKAALSGFLDTAGWLVGIMTISWSVTALQGHDDAKKAAVLVSVSAANFIGSWLGVMIGKKLIKAPVLASPAHHAIPAEGNALSPSSAGTCRTTPGTRRRSRS